MYIKINKKIDTFFLMLLFFLDVNRLDIGEKFLCPSVFSSDIYKKIYI